MSIDKWQIINEQNDKQSGLTKQTLFQRLRFRCGNFTSLRLHRHQNTDFVLNPFWLGFDSFIYSIKSILFRPSVLLSNWPSAFLFRRPLLFWFRFIHNFTILYNEILSINFMASWNLKMHSFVHAIRYCVEWRNICNFNESEKTHANE